MTTESHVDEFQSQGLSPGLIRETTSPTGHRVTLAIEQTTYQGATSGAPNRGSRGGLRLGRG